MLVLVLMLRHSITKLREFGLNVLLPLDSHIYFHKVIGRYFLKKVETLQSCTIQMKFLLL